jgi:hypothetical protein
MAASMTTVDHVPLRLLQTANDPQDLTSGACLYSSFFS